MLARLHDLVLHRAALRGVEGLRDLAISGGRIAAIAPTLPLGVRS